MKLTSLRIAVGLLLGSSAALGVGCGNYSNEDIGFYNALPTRDQLTSGTPTVKSSSNALWGGSGPRSPNAGIGQHSGGYDTTRGVIAVGNGFVLGALDLVEKVTERDATSKSVNERIWGPVPRSLTQNAELVMDRDGGHYDYRVEVRPRNSTGAWVPLLTGEFDVGDSVRHGVGSMTYLAETARNQGVDPDTLSKVKELSASYDTRTDGGLSIMLRASYEPELNQKDFVYQYLETQGAPTTASVDGSLPDAGTEIYAAATWIADGAGRSELQTKDGTGSVTADVIECWDTTANAVYQELDGFFSTGSKNACQPPLP